MLDHLGMDFDAGNRRIERCCPQVEKTGGTRANQYNPPAQIFRIDPRRPILSKRAGIDPVRLFV